MAIGSASDIFLKEANQCFFRSSEFLNERAPVQVDPNLMECTRGNLCMHRVRNFDVYYINKADSNEVGLCICTC